MSVFDCIDLISACRSFKILFALDNIVEFLETEKFKKFHILFIWSSANETVPIFDTY